MIAEFELELRAYVSTANATAIRVNTPDFPESTKIGPQKVPKSTTDCRLKMDFYGIIIKS